MRYPFGRNIQIINDLFKQDETALKLDIKCVVLDTATNQFVQQCLVSFCEPNQHSVLNRIETALCSLSIVGKSKKEAFVKHVK